MRFSWRMIFNDFRETYPGVWKRGTTYQPYDFMTILITVPGVGKYIYDYYKKRLDLVEEFTDEEEVRCDLSEEREKRAAMFRYELPRLMMERNYTQQDISDMSGISRESINAYLSGKKIPKMSTMDKIYRGLGLE